mmetsp:Transcript_43149/g.127865  ORF Transcript_43149/g.127865 Transcript_43149/m.127865 type:complete len:670 (-) Transcript_43149:8-2017(-)
MALEAFQKRLNLMEKSHCDTLEIQTRHEHWWKATQARLDGFQARLVEDHRAGEAYQVGLRDELKKHGVQTEDKLASMKERVDYVEILLGQSGDHNAKGFEVIKTSYSKLASELERVVERMSSMERGFADKHAELHGRLSEEQKTRLSHHSSMSAHQSTVAERLAALERSLGSAISDHTKDVTATNSKLDQLHTQLHGRLDTHHSSLREHVAKEQSVRDAHHQSTQERLDYIEHLLGDALGEVRMPMSSPTGSGLRSSPAGSRREVPGDSNHISVLARFSYLERALTDTQGELQVKIDGLGQRMSATELQTASHGAAVDGLKQSHATLNIGNESHIARHASLSDQVREMDKALTDLNQRSARELDRVQSHLERLENDHGQAIGEHRQAFTAHRQSFEKSEEVSARVRDRVGALARSHGEETAELRSRLEAEVSRRKQMQEDLSQESRMRDALERAVQHHLDREASERQALEGTLQEVVAKEQVLRNGIKELIAAQQASGKTTSEQFDKEKKAREATQEELAELIRAEGAERRQEISRQQEFLRKEQSERLLVSDAIAAEKGERFRQSERLQQIVQSVQQEVRTLGPGNRSKEARFRLQTENEPEKENAVDAQDLTSPGATTQGGFEPPRSSPGSALDDLASSLSPGGAGARPGSRLSVDQKLYDRLQGGR